MKSHGGAAIPRQPVHDDDGHHDDFMHGHTHLRRIDRADESTVFPPRLGDPHYTNPLLLTFIPLALTALLIFA